MSKPTLTVTKDFTKAFQEIIGRFKNDTVLVGIPESSNRNDGPIGNAALLAINNFGSPLQNIPARPVMRVGIRNAQAAIAEQFKIAAKSALSKGVAAIDTYYERAGIIASNSIKKAITDQDFDGAPGPSEATLAARKASGFSGTKSLIVTGQLRSAISYVVRKWR